MSLPIKFEKVRWKNLFSYPNYFTEIDLSNPMLNLIVGDSGAGKSTILDAVLFALYGKTYKKVNKSSIVNSMNNKDCVSEIEFSVGENHYKVVRGVKPNLFEIWENGKQLDNEAKSTDIQAKLEKKILGGLNYNTFTQTCIIGSANFVPFMQLSTPQRREIVESLLSLSIFTTASDITKRRIKEKEKEKVSVSNEVRILQSRIEEKRKTLNYLYSQKANASKTNDAEIEELNQTISSKDSKIKELTDKAGDLKVKISELRKNKIYTSEEENTMALKGSEMKSRRATTKEKIDLWNKGQCPTCQQKLDTSDKSLFDIEHAQSMVNDLMDEMTILRDTLVENKKLRMELDTLMGEGKSTVQIINRTKEDIEDLRSRIEKLSHKTHETFDDSLIDDVNKEIEETTQAVKVQESDIDRITEDMKYLKVCLEMFKDSGIKSKIISVFIPLLNQKINEYLTTFEVNILFEFDENFDETIKGRGRDDFVYNNLSEGEKRRLDLAILFTWLEVAELKNSVSTNLLIADELMDSSLDFASVNNLVDILKSMIDNSEKSVYIISHRQELSDMFFENVIKVEKQGDFSSVN